MIRFSIFDDFRFSIADPVGLGVPAEPAVVETVKARPEAEPYLINVFEGENEKELLRGYCCNCLSIFDLAVGR